jgi:hypothetical protein
MSTSIPGIIGSAFPLAPYSPLSEVIPFTYKDGETYLSILNRTREKLTELITFANALNSADATNYQELLAIIVKLRQDFINAVNGLGPDTLIRFVSNYNSLAEAVADTPEKGTLWIDEYPSGALGESIVIPRAMTIAGTSSSEIITFSGCDGFVINTGVSDVKITDIQIRHTPVDTMEAPNTFTGIHIKGTPLVRSWHNLINNVVVDGFATAVKTISLWESNIFALRTYNCRTGVDIYGLSENNTLSGSRITCQDGVPPGSIGTVGVRLNGQKSDIDLAAQQSEGWFVHHNFIHGFETGLQARGYGNFIVDHNIFDAIGLTGIHVTNYLTAYGGNCVIDSNWISIFAGQGGENGVIHFDNVVAGVRSNKIVNNEIIGSVNSQVGIFVKNATPAIISENNVIGSTQYDIRVTDRFATIVNNRCLSNLVAPLYNIFIDSGKSGVVANNFGTNWISSAASGVPNGYTSVGGLKISRGTGIPTNNQVVWNPGDRIINTNVVAGQPEQWVCTVAGAPGEWIPVGVY